MDRVTRTFTEARGDPAAFTCRCTKDGHENHPWVYLSRPKKKVWPLQPRRVKYQSKFHGKRDYFQAEYSNKCRLNVQCTNFRYQFNVS